MRTSRSARVSSTTTSNHQQSLPEPRHRADRQALNPECTQTLASMVAGQLGSFADFETFIVATTRGMLSGDHTGHWQHRLARHRRAWPPPRRGNLRHQHAPRQRAQGGFSRRTMSSLGALTGSARPRCHRHRTGQPSTSVVMVVVQLRAVCRTFIGKGVGRADESMSSDSGPLVHVDECWCASGVPTRSRRCTAYLCECMDTGGWPCDMAQRREVLCVVFRLGGRGNIFRKSARFLEGPSHFCVFFRSFNKMIRFNHS
ncbi:hypothetical protein V8E53_002172 [Lactarius tabidus]